MCEKTVRDHCRGVEWQWKRLLVPIRNLITLATQQLYGASHQMHGAKAVGKTGVVGSRIHQIGHTDLLDTPKSLEIRMLDDIEMQFIGDADEAVNGVVEDFLFVGYACHVPLILPQS